MLTSNELAANAIAATLSTTKASYDLEAITAQKKAVAFHHRILIAVKSRK